MPTPSWLSFGTRVTAAVALGLLTIAPAEAQPASRPLPCTGSVPFVSGTEGYHTFRIPAVVKTGSGIVLAFAEGRRDASGDAGKIDTVLRRSFDGGCTWGPLTVTTANGTEGTAGNPSPVVLPSGRIVLLTTHNAGFATEHDILTGVVSPQDSRRVFVQNSDDGGRSWSTAVDITPQTKQDDWRWYATGPGHALVLRGGGHDGRIIVPSDHSSAPPAGSGDTGAETKYYGNHDIYSDDGGKTWHIGYVDEGNESPEGYTAPNENIAAQLPGGEIYFNGRDPGSAPGTRVDGYSRDGGLTLVEPLRPQITLTGPVVQGSVLQTTDPRVLLYSGPSDPASRKIMQIRTSNDRGHTWHAVYTVSKDPAAYSDLVQLDRSTLGLLYETGKTSAYETIAFQRIATSKVDG